MHKLHISDQTIILPQPIQQIIIVEDDTEVLELLTIIFKEVLAVIPCVNGIKGEQAILANTKPCFVMSDFNMPGLTGAEVAKRTLSHRRQFNMPLTMAAGVSGTQEQEVKELLKTGTISAFCKKPVGLEIVDIVIATKL